MLVVSAWDIVPRSPGYRNVGNHNAAQKIAWRNIGNQIVTEENNWCKKENNSAKEKLTLVFIA